MLWRSIDRQTKIDVVLSRQINKQTEIVVDSHGDRKKDSKKDKQQLMLQLWIDGQVDRIDRN